ncbi:hypothetical protein [Janibacter anophelis]|uniref:hypothetical protein n=1 Tax=Janibacter anophelis TaxID=319054 RepID=UPI00082DFAAF|nr:hypothetical protein [Janibacter anophelis]
MHRCCTRLRRHHVVHVVLVARVDAGHGGHLLGQFDRAEQHRDIEHESVPEHEQRGGRVHEHIGTRRGHAVRRLLGRHPHDAQAVGGREP